ncbi:MAG TPA: T9SS type A sorting domain-containing protein, partial [Chitinophagales bacterium]|nr:T9SS type A sorting domain-containing protein [Chitinophagales bacterium]
YWAPSACNISNINIPAGTTDTSILLGLKPVVYSPYITINGSIDRQRVCMPATYTAQYCNTGTAPFTGILILEIDTLLHVDSASAQIVTSIGNKYYFVVPQLDAMQCATLKVYCTVSCEPTLMDRAVCIDAHAEQDTVINVSPLWDQSNLEIQALYVPGEDSVTFTLRNNGNGGMSQPKSLLVIEDNVILLQTPLQLGAGVTLERKVPANGSTWRGTIEQTAYNPYSKFVTAAIEGAGTNQQGGISVGYFMDYPINGYYGYHYSACGIIRNSYDPNEKVVSPEGAGTDKLIDSTTELEYTLYFQNTGNDTAYVIRITDTLADFLDPATIVTGAASHKYTVEFIDDNVLEFTFTNINLPDSGSNQMGSNGFVKFRIKQKPGNSSGTAINNKVDIYFDYNPPITTNTATVRIGKVLPTGIQTLYKNKPVTIQAFPNPFSASARITVEGENFDKLQLSVYDLSGRMVKQLYSSSNNFTITNDNLQAGTYIFEITGNHQPVGRGKLLVQ